MGFASSPASPKQGVANVAVVEESPQTWVVGLVGMSCSGKSTSAASLSLELNGAEVLVLSQDDHFKYEQYLTDECPRKDFDGHAWKDWETPKSVDWTAFATAIADAKAKSTSPYLVVEGFQLCANPEILSLIDVVVVLDLPKADCWDRRKSRALSMRHLEPGVGDNKNYEVLKTYIFGEEEEARIAEEAVRAAAAAGYSDDGDDAWLRLYFEEMVWPEAQRQRQDLSHVHDRGIPVLPLEASTPVGKEEWLAQRMPEAAAFVRRSV